MQTNRLREALVKAQTALVICEWPDGTRMEGVAELLRQIDAALAAPPRNCDRFATIEDARKAHEAICEKYGKCHNGCPLNNEEHYSAFDCFEAWLFATTTKKEGVNDEQK